MNKMFVSYFYEKDEESGLENDLVFPSVDEIDYKYICNLQNHLAKTFNYTKVVILNWKILEA